MSLFFLRRTLCQNVQNSITCLVKRVLEQEKEKDFHNLGSSRVPVVSFLFETRGFHDSMVSSKETEKEEDKFPLISGITNLTKKGVITCSSIWLSKRMFFW
eukprot:gb/GECG01006303.1/.p2 GENE.gb/GECG01006303.1/~~gb/GECG01006303.1/.p2  ORF type:complete len:101 (-),score=7.41 gb/GECG01006303.1/:27-329(-)